MSKKAEPVFREKDLFPPVRLFFEAQGFVCDGEVHRIDLYMEKDGLTAAAELKLSLDFRAVQQAALRQKTVDAVFLGIPFPRDVRSRAFRDKLYLLKRLGIGLICVSLRTGKVEMLIPPIETETDVFRQHNRQMQQRIREEFAARKLRCNPGGVHNEPLMTAYREKALTVLGALEKLGGEASTRDIRSVSRVENSTSILYDDHYGWFIRAGRGRYRLSETGKKACISYEREIGLLLSSPETE